MKPVTGAALDDEQKVVLAQLTQAVEKINEASDLVLKNRGSERAAWEAIALSLGTISKMLVVSKAIELNMVNRLPAFK